MPSDVNVNADPILVYGMVGLLIGALVLALIFVIPRRDLGAVTKSDAAQTPPGEAWMPGGDIFGREKPPAAPPEEPVTDLPPYFGPPADPTNPQAAHDPWSTTDQAGQQPRWDRR
ncbi:MAG: hypothetical protein QFC55_00420 [Chloroflexota bacterium]|nr:hypothetical protein [Chloroflexota bacterium]